MFFASLVVLISLFILVLILGSEKPSPVRVVVPRRKRK